LVIDTQGAEAEVIEGGKGSLWRFHWVQVETSSTNVYINGNTRETVDQLLNSAGFAMEAEIEQRPGHGDRIYKRIQEISASDRCFQSRNYQAINTARLRHLSGLPINLKNQSVLELGSGPGDITALFLDQNCCITSIDARPENIREASLRHQPSKQWNGFVYELPQIISPFKTSYDIVIAYGILYHLEDPLSLLRAVAAMQPRNFVLETCVTPETAPRLGPQQQLYPLHRCSELATDGSQSVTGVGCRPDRRWLWKTLQTLFDYVYCCTHQPHHPEFPLNWRSDAISNVQGLTRMIFICSSEPMNSDLLTESLPMLQHRSEHQD
jgi:2-polyprenyl-3-methyl-5-hydroxy-6-metoxy-1,4-benzoquinol methylase